MSSERKHIRSKIQALAEAGVGIKEIAKRLDVSRNTVRKWVRKEDADISDVERSGRPTKMTPNSKEKIRKMVKDKVVLERAVLPSN